MAEEEKEEAGDAAEAAPAKPKSKLKLIIIAAAALVVLGGGGGAGWWFFIKKKADAQAAEMKAGGPKTQVAFVELKDMMVNLSQTQGAERQSYLKVKIALEVSDPKIVPDIQPLVPRIEDTFQVYMRELRAPELDGSAAVIRLKEELLKRVNIAVYPAKVDAILFKEILMQ